jgi:hypothetical protein
MEGKVMQGRYVIENKNGQVVRSLQWESSEASVVYRKDTRRIVAVSDVSDLDAQKIPYSLLAEVTKSSVQKHAVKIGEVGYLKFVPEINNLSPSVVANDENLDNYKAALKWTLGSGLALLLLLLLIGHFTSGVEKPEEQQVVIVAPREKLEVVIPHKQKPILQQTVAQKTPLKKIHAKVAQIKKVQRQAVAKQASLNNMGALGVLGSLSKSINKGGLQLNAVNTTAGPGLGGTAGSGGMQTSAYGKGLIAAPLGPNGKAQGAGGYGNHGAGGGKAGYGKMSLVGSATAYFEPVQSDAIVEGGLDRAQIAEVIQRHLGQIRACYEQGLQVTPGLSGRVAIKFLIGGNGFVNMANVANSSLHSGTIEGCIVEHLKGWKFPEPRGGVIVKVNYPFVLKRVSQS